MVLRLPSLRQRLPLLPRTYARSHSMAASRTQPPWKEPHPGKPGKLRLWNSLTRSKTEFKPMDSEGTVTWYSCGPTVYDDAHLGHARNYMSIDILLRVMRSYFNYPVRFVQNITDVDDKIILRGRQQHLLQQFKSENPTVASQKVLDTTLEAYNAYIKKNLPLLDPEVKPEDFNSNSAEKYAAVIEGKSDLPMEQQAKLRMHLKTAGNAATALLAPSKSTSEDNEKFWDGAEDVLLPYLDSLHGSSQFPNEIFTTLTRKYEQRFFDDMHSLNVADPDQITRVTEFVPQIIKFVEKIVSNGYAYATESGDVYFNIEAFEKTPNNHYAKLAPWSRNDTALLADGEGALSTKKSSEKKGSGDFALWKSSKPGEPSWPSPWGPGRPGWHIECSVMASETLGSTIDIHSGGVDLCFPHHDNELAQSEAYWSTEGGWQWISYFLHMGHLSISGSKMSKSLKNFITIREALARGEYTARSLRIIFLLGGWHDGIEITNDMKKAAAGFESAVTNFFYKVKDLNVNPNAASTGTEDAKVRAALESTKSKVHEHLADSLDTPGAMRSIRDLITEYNSTDKAGLSDAVSFEVARFVTRILRIFGLDGTADPNDGGIGWSGTEIPVPDEGKPFVYAAARLRDEVRQRAIAGELSEEALDSIISEDTPSKQQDAAAVPYAEILSTFQEKLRSLAQEQASNKAFLELSDRLRDVDLWDVGVALEDRPNAPALVRPVDAELRAEREQREAIARQKAEAKQKREREEAEKKAKLAAQAKISPQDMFKTEEYSAWNEDGLPTKDKEGADLPKSKAKKLAKEWEKQKKLHEEYLKSGGSS